MVPIQSEISSLSRISNTQLRYQYRTTLSILRERLILHDNTIDRVQVLYMRSQSRRCICLPVLHLRECERGWSSTYNGIDGYPVSVNRILTFNRRKDTMDGFDSIPIRWQQYSSWGILSKGESIRNNKLFRAKIPKHAAKHIIREK